MLFEKFRLLVERVMSSVDYLALYPAKVIKQASDGTLELQPDDTRIPGMSKIKIKTGIPGLEIKMSPDSMVLIGFMNGDPSKPYAALWDKPTLLEVTLSAETFAKLETTTLDVKATTVNLKASMADLNSTVIKLANGTRPVARLGDAVTITAVPSPTGLNIVLPPLVVVGTCPAGAVIGTATPANPIVMVTGMATGAIVGGNAMVTA